MDYFIELDYRSPIAKIEDSIILCAIALREAGFWDWNCQRKLDSDMIEVRNADYDILDAIVEEWIARTDKESQGTLIAFHDNGLFRVCDSDTFQANHANAFQ